ncbi:hypothetical protein [Streptomyces sp. CRN 30]|uniref:hypothetical protein n=1 Tax=Streptomyces sp. CRN 30 TaxID=3075613 RepID=UPI002A815B7F|nr:hypothetical protein [Streptomyces sp. CRN 30]
MIVALSGAMLPAGVAFAVAAPDIRSNAESPQRMFSGLPTAEDERQPWRERTERITRPATKSPNAWFP